MIWCTVLWVAKVGGPKKICQHTLLMGGPGSIPSKHDHSVWQLITLQPLELQDLIVPLLKAPNPLVNIFIVKEFGSIFKIWFFKIQRGTYQESFLEMYLASKNGIQTNFSENFEYCRLMSGRKARGLGSGKSTGSASHAARQRNLKQKFVSLLKKFKVTDPEELDQENVDQKLSGNTHYIVCLYKVMLDEY